MSSNWNYSYMLKSISTQIPDFSVFSFFRFTTIMHILKIKNIKIFCSDILAEMTLIGPLPELYVDAPPKKNHPPSKMQF